MRLGRKSFLRPSADLPRHTHRAEFHAVHDFIHLEQSDSQRTGLRGDDVVILARSAASPGTAAKAISGGENEWSAQNCRQPASSLSVRFRVSAKYLGTLPAKAACREMGVMLGSQANRAFSSIGAFNPCAFSTSFRINHWSMASPSTKIKAARWHWLVLSRCDRQRGCDAPSAGCSADN